MNKIFAIIAACIALAGYSHAQEQGPGAYLIGVTGGALLSGANGTNCAVAAASTNSYLGFDVSEYDAVGLEVTLKAQGAGTSTVQLMGHKSLSSTFYETTPSLSQLVTLNGTNPVTVFIPQSVIGASNFKLRIGNTNAALALTNILAGRLYKAPAIKEK